MTPKTPGVLSLVARTTGSLNVLYPSLTLYPSASLYPSSSTGLVAVTPGALTLVSR